MGKRDFRHRETKKPKKDGKKVSATILPFPITVEVVKKEKKRKEEEE